VQIIYLGGFIEALKDHSRSFGKIYQVGDHRGQCAKLVDSVGVSYIRLVLTGRKLQEAEIHHVSILGTSDGTLNKPRIHSEDGKISHGSGSLGGTCILAERLESEAWCDVNICNSLSASDI
jgi:hypothetical protein